jgi:hypothetical protein
MSSSSIGLSTRRICSTAHISTPHSFPVGHDNHSPSNSLKISNASHSFIDETKLKNSVEEKLSILKSTPPKKVFKGRISSPSIKRGRVEELVMKERWGYNGLRAVKKSFLQDQYGRLSKMTTTISNIGNKQADRREAIYMMKALDALEYDGIESTCDYSRDDKTQKLITGIVPGRRSSSAFSHIKSRYRERKEPQNELSIKELIEQERNKRIGEFMVKKDQMRSITRNMEKNKRIQ